MSMLSGSSWFVVTGSGPGSCLTVDPSASVRGVTGTGDKGDWDCAMGGCGMAPPGGLWKLRGCGGKGVGIKPPLPCPWSDSDI